jgi:hypothetical protein
VVLLLALTVVSGDAMAQWTTSGTTIFNSNTGNVGIGTNTPTAKLHVFSNTLPAFTIEHATEARFQLRVAGAPVFLFNHDGTNAVMGAQNTGGGLRITTNGTPRISILASGNVGIGTNTPGEKLHVVGNVQVAGTLFGTNIQAQYQDVAEWVPSTTDLAAGTVVVLNRDRNNEVMASSTPYDTSVAGVVSAQPGLILGLSGEGKEQVATTGRVKVRVDATNGPIRVGDLLVTSAKPGMAMRSEPMDLNGRKFHQPGTIIGKALEPLERGEGEILVLLSMQ